MSNKNDQKSADIGVLADDGVATPISNVQYLINLTHTHKPTDEFCYADVLSPPVAGIVGFIYAVASLPEWSWRKYRDYKIRQKNSAYTLLSLLFQEDTYLQDLVWWANQDDSWWACAAKMITSPRRWLTFRKTLKEQAQAKGITLDTHITEEFHAQFSHAQKVLRQYNTVLTFYHDGQTDKYSLRLEGPCQGQAHTPPSLQPQLHNGKGLPWLSLCWKTLKSSTTIFWLCAFLFPLLGAIGVSIGIWATAIPLLVTIAVLPLIIWAHSKEIKKQHAAESDPTIAASQQQKWAYIHREKERIILQEYLKHYLSGEASFVAPYAPLPRWPYRPSPCLLEGELKSVITQGKAKKTIFTFCLSLLAGLGGFFVPMLFAMGPLSALLIVGGGIGLFSASLVGIALPWIILVAGVLGLILVGIGAYQSSKASAATENKLQHIYQTKKVQTLLSKITSLQKEVHTYYRCIYELRNIQEKMQQEVGGSLHTIIIGNIPSPDFIVHDYFRRHLRLSAPHMSGWRYLKKAIYRFYLGLKNAGSGALVVKLALALGLAGLSIGGLSLIILGATPLGWALAGMITVSMLLFAGIGIYCYQQKKKQQWAFEYLDSDNGETLQAVYDALKGPIIKGYREQAVFSLQALYAAVETEEALSPAARQHFRTQLDQLAPQLQSPVVCQMDRGTPPDCSLPNGKHNGSAKTRHLFQQSPRSNHCANRQARRHSAAKKAKITDASPLPSLLITRVPLPSAYNRQLKYEMDNREEQRVVNRKRA